MVDVTFPPNFDWNLGPDDDKEETVADQWNVDIPTIYFDEKVGLLNDELKRLHVGQESQPNQTAPQWQKDLLLRIRGLAMVIHDEADQWITAIDRRELPPTSIVRRVP